MWPWGHLAVGYLLYSLWRRRRGSLPAYPEVVIVLFGTQFPDLVDKPLAWDLGVLPGGRTLAHSAITATLIIAVLYLVVAPRIGRAPVFAFSLGYLSHLVADLPFGDLAAGNLTFTTYLAWPLLPPPPYDGPKGFIAHFLAFRLGPYEWFQFLLVGLALVLWYLDGFPGWAEFRVGVARLRRALPG